MPLVKQLITLYNSLEGEDISYCRKLIKSPIYNARAKKSDPLLLLFEALVNNRKEPIDSDEDLFKLAFNTTKFDSKTKSRLKSELADLIEEYLVLKAFREDPFLKNIYLLKALRQQKMEVGFKQTYQKLIKKVNNQGLQNADYHLYRSALNYEYYSNEIDKKREEILDEFHTANKELDYYLVSQKLKNLCVLMTDQLGMNNTKKKNITALDIGVISFAKELIKEKDTPPIILLYYSCYEMLHEEDKEENDNAPIKSAYHNFATNLKKHYTILNKEEAVDALQMLLNFCTRRINIGLDRDVFFQEQLKHYKFGFEKKILPKIIPKFAFKNIVSVACQIGDYNWAESFMEENKEKLVIAEKGDSSDNEIFINYMKSIIDFKQGKYEKVIDLLKNLKLAKKDYGFECDVRKMLICSYFEREHSNPHTSINSFQIGSNDKKDVYISTDSFLVYLKRNKKRINGYSHYYNFALFVKKRLECSDYDNDRAKKAKAIKEFEATKVMAEREWVGRKWGI